MSCNLEDYNHCDSAAVTFPLNNSTKYWSAHSNATASAPKNEEILSNNLPLRARSVYLATQAPEVVTENKAKPIAA